MAHASGLALWTLGVARAANRCTLFFQDFMQLLHPGIEHQLSQSSSENASEAELNNVIFYFPYDRFLEYLLHRGGSWLGKAP
jgi:hypothetical protein